MPKPRPGIPDSDRRQATRGAGQPPARHVDDLYRELQQNLAARADTEYAAALKRSIGTNVRVVGVRVPDIRELARDAVSRLADGVQDAADLMDRCAAGGVREELLAGAFVLARRPKHLTPSLLTRVDKWIEALDNWETCDQLATGVAAVIIAKDPAQAKHLTTWTKSKNAWRRRFAAVAAAGLNQKGRRFPAEALGICVHLLNDPDPLVRKAVAWAIREVAIVDATAAREFVSKHARVMHPSVLKQSGQ